jgi:GT2 family glycosyltransferase
MSSVKGISVVIPNYNGATLLPEILPALYVALQNTQLPYEVIVSDDCSTDSSLIFLKEQYPQVDVIENKVNQGFSKTINQGIYNAKHELVLLLNSDVKLTPTFFEKQLPYFELPDTFGVMSKIVGWDDDVIQDGGKYPSFHGTKIKTSGNYVPLQNDNNIKLYSMYLSGANALISREKIIQLGGFDEIFSPFYVEDFELSLRAWRLGWKCYYEHNAVCRHKTSTTIKNKDSKKFVRKIYNRNKMLLHAIHLPNYKKPLWYLQLFAEAIVQTALGKYWFFAAVKSFLQSGAAIKRSKQNLLSVAEGKPLFSVKEVVHIVLAQINTIEYRRIK